MWKKNEPGSFTAQAPTHMPVSQPERSRKELSTIGSSMTITGELTGNEDLEVHGKVEGTVSLKKHSVLIGERGRGKAAKSGENGRLAAQSSSLTSRSTSPV